MSQSIIIRRPGVRVSNLIRSVGLTRDDAAILAAAAVLAVSVYFLAFPGVDIAVSRLF